MQRMNDLRFTLLSDGSSDRVLIPILRWLLRRNGVTRAIQSAWADLRQLPRPPKTLIDRIRAGIDLFPADLFFIHRDAERLSYADRKTEIVRTISSCDWPLDSTIPVCVVPVRMQEAWLLFDETAIRHAAGNPSGEQPLEMPAQHGIESLPDPKSILHGLLKEASGLSGRRRRRFRPQMSAGRVVEFLNDFSPLLNLHAFRQLDRDLKEVIDERHWRRTVARDQRH